MTIWVDADACPRVIKEILYRAAQKRQIQLILVANQPLRVPASSHISSRLVGAGFDVADEQIVEWLVEGDLVRKPASRGYHHRERMKFASAIRFGLRTTEAQDQSQGRRVSSRQPTSF